MLRQITTLFVLGVNLVCWLSVSARSIAFEPDSLLNPAESIYLNAFEIKHPKLHSLFTKQYNLNLTDSDPIELYSFVARWLRVPYRYGGLSRKGVDCQGFVRVIYDSLYCTTLPAGAGSQYLVCETIPKDNLKTGDLVFFCIGTRSISHVGIYLKDGWFAHATVSGVGVVMSRLDAPYYRRWFYRAGRVRQISDVHHIIS